MNTTKHRPLFSLSGKLILFFIVMAVFFVVLVGAGIRHAFQEHFTDNIRPHITQYLEYVKTDIGIPADRMRAQALSEKLNIEIQISDVNGDWSSNGKHIAMDELDIKHRHEIDGHQYFYVEDKRNQHYVMIREAETSLIFNLPNMRQQERSLKGWLPLLIMLFLLLVLYFGTRRLFAPLKTIKEGVQKFGAGEIEHRIHINRKDELGELATSFNAMANDIQQMLDAKRQLLLAISHELRSPLTRSRLAAEMLDENNNKSQIIQDIKEMEALIEDLMETERLSSRHTKLNKAQHDISTLIEEVIATWFIDNNILMHLPDTPILLDVDAARIKLLIKNLLDNAIRSTPPGKPAPEINLTTEEKHVVISIKDQGNGIEAQHIPKLTEPFYRVDPARQRKTGGYGLGLYLCKMITKAHDGTLTIESHIGVGTIIVIKFPCLS